MFNELPYNGPSSYERAKRYFRPGAVVASYPIYEYDLVLEFRVYVNEGWAVLVQKCDVNGVVFPDARQRLHMTSPDFRDYNAVLSRIRGYHTTLHEERLRRAPKCEACGEVIEGIGHGGFFHCTYCNHKTPYTVNRLVFTDVGVRSEG